MSNTLVYRTATVGGGRTMTVRYEPADLAPVRNIRRPRVAKRGWRLTCSKAELARADRAL